MKKDTPTGRVLAIVEQLAQAKASREGWQVWESAFGAGPFAGSGRLQLLMPAFRQFDLQLDLARERGHKTSLPAHLVDEPISRIKELVGQSLVNLSSQWGNFQPLFAERVKDITYLAGLDQLIDEEVVGDDVVAEIMAAIAALREALQKPDLLPPLRAFVEQQIEALASIIILSGIGGGRAFSDAVFQGLADLKASDPVVAAKAPEEVKEALSKGWRAALSAMETMRNASSMLSLYFNVAKMIEGGKDGIKSLPWIGE